MATGRGGEQTPSERLRALILERFGTYRAFAAKLDPPMDPTQLSAALKPHRRPEPETLDRFSVALGWEPNILRGWYSYVADEAQPADRESGPEYDDDPIAVARAIAAVEAYRDPDWQREREEQRRRLSPAAYGHWCLLLDQQWQFSARHAIENLKLAGA